MDHSSASEPRSCERGYSLSPISTRLPEMFYENRYSMIGRVSEHRLEYDFSRNALLLAVEFYDDSMTSQQDGFEIGFDLGFRDDDSDCPSELSLLEWGHSSGETSTIVSTH